MASATLLIATSWDQSVISQHFRALATALAKRDHQVIILVDKHRVVDEPYHSNITVYTWPSYRPVKIQDALFLLKIIKTHRPDCVLANFGAVNVSLIVSWLAKVHCRIAWYHTLHTQINLDAKIHPVVLKLLRFRRKMIYRLATHFGTNAAVTARDLQQTCSVPVQKIHIKPYSLRDPVEDSAAVADRLPDTLVCVGRLHPSKGQDVVIRALRQVKETRPDVRIQFIGEGPSRDHLESLARNLDVAQLCEFTGNLKHVEVMDRMRKAALVIVPSIDEAFGIVNVEALAVGTPVIASKTGGIPEIIRDGIEGLLVPPGDSTAMAASILQLLIDHRVRAEMGRNARRRFLSAFEQRSVIEDQANWLCDLINS
jgi:glycosyltransferase involved in cell wall biosynthesis